MNDTPRVNAEISKIGLSGVDWHYSATKMARLARQLEIELVESERALAKSEFSYEQLVNYLTAKLGTKGEHGVFGTIDNVAARLAKLEDENQDNYKQTQW